MVELDLADEAFAPLRNVSTERETIARRLGDYEQISGVLWIVLGAVQICLIVTAIAGVWNVFAGITRISMAKRIRRLDATVPADFERLGSLVVIGVVNLLLGALFGLLFVGFDLYVREQVLSNRWAFTGASPDPRPRTEASSAQEAATRLEQLGRLRATGVLTEAEFAEQKTRWIHHL